MRAMSLAPKEKRLKAIQAAMRPNGSLNVSKLSELAVILFGAYGLELLECRVCGASAKDACECRGRYIARDG
jgi:hypothetical protein